VTGMEPQSAVWNDHVSDGFESRGALNISQNNVVLANAFIYLFFFYLRVFW
jgi:hypothetical protein